MQGNLQQKRIRDCDGGKHFLEAAFFSFLSGFRLRFVCWGVELDIVESSNGKTGCPSEAHRSYLITVFWKKSIYCAHSKQDKEFSL